MQPWLYPAYSGKALLDVELGIPFGDAVAGDRRREPALWTGRARASGTATRRRGSGKRTPPWRGRPTRRASENREFGRLLAGWPGSGLHDRSLLGVEAVLDRRGTVPQRNLDAFAVGLDAFYTAVGEELASVGGPYSPRTALNFARRGAVYLVITGTPAFFEGPQGVRRLPPLAQRLAVDFSGAPRFDNPRAPQVRLHNFDLPRLQGVGRKIRDLHAGGATAPARVELEP